MATKTVIDRDALEDALMRSMTSCDNPGFCTDCGSEQDGCEPDAREYKCENCGKNKVYGAEELAIMGYLY